MTDVDDFPAASWRRQRKPCDRPRVHTPCVLLDVRRAMTPARRSTSPPSYSC